jgi:phenylpropionate dioxygenase-like ring-hydroxylating dioxygenase large terminal subunit
MLSAEDNELITRTGPGTPMGKLFREYWLPFALSKEVTSDGDPVRIMLLNEKLIAFRDSNGKVGLIQNHCPHRGASLFFGRNEEAGIRCVYHGWKFDVTGQCVDMPNEPAESNFKNKVRATAYPCVERGGIIWTYMGPRSVPPELPNLEPNVVAGAENTVWVTQQESNWLQVLEGDIDTIHVNFLHGGARPNRADRSAQFIACDMPAGAMYGAYRPAETPGETYWRIAHWLFPNMTMPPPGRLGVRVAVGIRVPMDDYHTLSFSLQPQPGQGEIGVQSAVQARQTNGFGQNGIGNPVLPSTTDWFGRFRTAARGDNDFLIDREVQRRKEGGAGYTGIQGIAVQDAAMTWGMGPIYDRTNERLGTSDTMVIRVRRRLIRAAKALAEHGITPPGVDDPGGYAVRSGWVNLPDGLDWLAGTVDLRRAFVDHPELADTPQSA